ncbi:MAG: polyphosphate polymerase domain-containing protein, partial [Bacteroidota bacterium]
MSTANDIEAILWDFEGISLKEVQKASLMRRKDSKFVFSFVHLPTILSVVGKDYRVLEIEASRSHPYLTAYYDTADLEMYHLHHRGMANRHKIRFRRYGVSNLHFLEVKKKNSKGITIKNRVKTPGMDASILSTEEEFLKSCSPYGRDGMIPAMENSFHRITLVSHSQKERITLDYNLRFSNLLFDNHLELPGISIAEIKYESHLAGSSFNAALRQNHITPRRFSKYAIGMALLNLDLKQNRFKQKVR